MEPRVRQGVIGQRLLRSHTRRLAAGRGAPQRILQGVDIANR